MNMDGIAVITHSSPLSGLSYHAVGDFVLKQTNPLSLGGWRTVYKQSVLDHELIKSMNDITFQRVLEDYSFRNESLHYDHPYSTWVTGASDSFTINVKARVPTQNIQYIPEASEVMKWAWVQYVAIAWAVYQIVNVLRVFVYREQVVETYVRMDTVPKMKYNQF